ncbi:RNase III domain-containing protein [Xylona heveae TC161]|uniref:RNase III domain-containing protein n=1 Tax=Xylona heveae (strain CBS 132557 / TC161) TaxID=1328760 RepID=A0A165AD07_XYLHT|nr:RNase III domain-containing protein [Xylona heveae TC161]KZF20275.1 RNase III domain-containing protein [Xylona heveae TC161]
MASHFPIRPMANVANFARRQAASRPASFFFTQRSASQARYLSASPACQQDPPAPEAPRWMATPRAMVAPVRSRPRPRREWLSNEDPEKLNRFYVRILGNRGDQMLSEEVKWLAVTHKSFDHGRRGFNDRLAFLGKRIIELQANLATVQSPLSTQQSLAAADAEKDEYGRVPFKHPALEGLENTTDRSRNLVVDKKRLAQLASSYGLNRVLRWKPKNAESLSGSGIDTVLAHSMYAIVGAVALQRGGEAANTLTREKILAPLGVTA